MVVGKKIVERVIFMAIDVLLTHQAGRFPPGPAMHANHPR
jgi:hypothetical protein